MGDETTDLASNIIVELMYTQCYVNQNENLLLDVLFNTAISEEDKKVVVEGRVTLRKSTAGWDIHCKWNDGSK